MSSTVYAIMFERWTTFLSESCQVTSAETLTRKHGEYSRSYGQTVNTGALSQVTRAHTEFNMAHIKRMHSELPYVGLSEMMLSEQNFNF